MSIFLLMSVFAFSQSASAQCENLFNVTTTRTYSLATNKTTYVFAVTNVGSQHALSHWDLTFDFCPGQAPIFLNGATASYSTNGGVSYTNLPPPSLAIDPSQNCFTTPVLKFDFGSGGPGTTTYYKLVVNGYWIGGFTNAIFKFGNDCCSQPYNGTRACLLEPGPPVILCPAGVLQLACNQALPTPDPSSISVTSDCPEGVTVTFVSDVLVSTIDCVETYTRTYKATDACGGFAFCTQTITRKVDLVKPVITITGGVSTLGCNPTAEQIAAAFGTASVTDNCSTGLTATGTVGAESGTGCTRTTTKSWTVTDNCGNTQTATQTVTYTRDTEKPALTNTPPASITALCTASFETLPWVAPTYTDNCSAVTVVSIVTTPNIQQTACPAVYVRTWTVRDDCGNISTFSQTITVPCCEGCSPGFWKNHTSLWDEFTDYPVVHMPTGMKFITTTNFNTYFNLPAGTNGFPNNLTMQGAISQGGGGCIAMSRHAVAALLSSASGLNVPYPTGTSDFASLYTAIRNALLAGDCSGTLATQLEIISASDESNCGKFNNVITMNNAITPAPVVTVSASPNPYNDKIVFTIRSTVSGTGSFELFGLLGERVTQLYQGNIEKNAVKTLIYNAPFNNRKTLVYRFVVGNQVVTGKVININ